MIIFTIDSIDSPVWLNCIEIYIRDDSAGLKLLIPGVFGCVTDGRPVCCTFVDPIIRGFRGSAASWHYQLWGLQREHWQAYREFMSTAAFSDRATGLLSRVRFMSLDIVDPLARRRQVILPSRPVLAKVEAMVLDTNFGVAYFQPAVSDKIWQEPPSVAFSSNVCPGARDFAAAWFSGKSDPYSEASSYPFSEEPPFLGT